MLKESQLLAYATSHFYSRTNLKRIRLNKILCSLITIDPSIFRAYMKRMVKEVKYRTNAMMYRILRHESSKHYGHIFVGKRSDEISWNICNFCFYYSYWIGITEEKPIWSAKKMYLFVVGCVCQTCTICSVLIYQSKSARWSSQAPKQEHFIL